MPISSDRILYEDDALLVVNKLSGELTVKGRGVVGKLPLYDFLKKQYPGLKVLHRLDFETSGAVVFAKSADIAKRIIDADFSSWKKTYHSLVMGRVDRKAGVIRKKLPARGKGLVSAETHYTVLERFANSTYVECEISTGRHHQIRRHLAGIGHPLVLDREYGHSKFNQLFRSELGFGKFFLHASEVSFAHPVTGKKVSVQAPLPKGFAACLKKLRSL